MSKDKIYVINITDTYETDVWWFMRNGERLERVDEDTQDILREYEKKIEQSQDTIINTMRLRDALLDRIEENKQRHQSHREASGEQN